MKPQLERAATRRRILLFVAILAAVATVAFTLYVDARREAAAAVADFARDQAALAEAAANLRPSSALAELEEAPSLIVVVDEGGILHRPSGTRIVSPPLAEAISSGARTVVLQRADAAAIGLPLRTAVAGIARARYGRAIAVVATAFRVKDREIRAQERLFLGIVLAALLVFGFGGIALYIQRNEYLLERELATKEAEKQSEERLARADKLATMGAFATGIAHEIATPLGVIAARAEMTMARATDEKSSRAANAILEQTEKIRGIIQSFLSVARGEPPPRMRLAPRDLVARATRMVEHRYAAAGVGLDTDVANGVPDVDGEPRLLEQALVNLLLNACDASATAGDATNESGQRRVHATVIVEEGRVCFVVEDEGSGISPEVVARATEPFFTTKSGGAGTGLGLLIASEIAKHHQGRFVIRARCAGGTEARLELPEHRETPAAAPQETRVA